MLSPLHVLVNFRDRHVKVEVLAQDCPREENDEHGEGGIFVIGHLDFHRSEFYSPTDRGTSWWRFKTDGLPVRRLYVLTIVSVSPRIRGATEKPHLEVIHTVLIVLILQLRENDKRVTDEQM